MFNVLGIVITTKSNIAKIKREFYIKGYGEHFEQQMSMKPKARISPRTGKPVRKYTKHK